MFSEKLPNPIMLEPDCTFNENIDLIYSYFKENIMNQDNRNKLFGEYVYIDCSKWIDYKSELFWHLISLHEKEKFNVLPCNNCSSYFLCPGINCINGKKRITLSDGKIRNICLYRGIRLTWINKIIQLANEEDENIFIWKEDIKGKKLNKKVYIRFKHQGVDYVIIFEERYSKGVLKDYFLITAFPTFYVNKKNDYDKKYQEYVKKILYN